jgi:hypothetical protein
MRNLAVLPALKVVENRVRPLPALFCWRRQLIRHSTAHVVAEKKAGAAAAVGGRAVQISLGVRDHASLRIRALVAVEFVEDGFSPSPSIPRTELEDRAASRRGTGRAALVSCAVQVPRLVEDHATSRGLSVTAALEAVKHLLLPFCRGR